MTHVVPDPTEIKRCLECRHAPHGSLGFCPNLSSDNDCSRTYTGISEQAASGITADGMSLIRAERQRQVDAEGYTAEHDAEHGDIALVNAAQAYRAAGPEAWKVGPPHGWPWEPSAWKPRDPIANLIRAGALYLAAADLGNPYGERNAQECGDIIDAARERLYGGTTVAARDAEVSAKALQDAADEVRRIREHGLDPGMDSHPVSEIFESWLRDRAAGTSSRWRILTVPSEDALVDLLSALNVSGLHPELACATPIGGTSFLAGLTDPDADHVHITITEADSGRVHCCECTHPDEQPNKWDPNVWKPTYPVLALMTEWPDMKRVVDEEYITPWWEPRLAVGPIEERP